MPVIDGCTIIKNIFQSCTDKHWKCGSRRICGPLLFVVSKSPMSVNGFSTKNTTNTVFILPNTFSRKCDPKRTVTVRFDSCSFVRLMTDFNTKDNRGNEKCGLGDDKIKAISWYSNGSAGRAPSIPRVKTKFYRPDRRGCIRLSKLRFGCGEISC